MAGVKIRAGYTIIELLIAIAMIAALFTVTTFSVTASENSAKADKIITNMINIKTAFLAAYMHDREKFDNAPNNYTNGKLLEISALDKYLDNMKAADKSKYQLVYYHKNAEERNGWWVRYKLEGDSYELRYELADRAISRADKTNTYGQLIMDLRSYKTEGNIGVADRKNIASGNKYLIMKMR